MAWKIDASGDSVQRTTSLPSSTSYTMAGFARRSADKNAYEQLCAIENGTTNWNQLGWTSDADAISNHLSVQNDGAAPNVFALPFDPPLGQWFFWALTRSGTGVGALIGYVRMLHHKGRLASASNPATTSAFTPTAMTFGNDNSSEFLTGRIAGIKVWDAVLSPIELLRESYQLAPVRWKSLHLWAQENTGVDLSGRSRTLTQGGTLTLEPGPPVPLFQSRLSVEELVSAGSAFDPAFMYAMDRPWRDIVFSQPQVVASGMTPPDNVPN